LKGVDNALFRMWEICSIIFGKMKIPGRKPGSNGGKAEVGAGSVKQNVKKINYIA